MGTGRILTRYKAKQQSGARGTGQISRMAEMDQRLEQRDRSGGWSKGTGQVLHEVEMGTGGMSRVPKRSVALLIKENQFG